jgi:hypothetical protein
MERDISSFRAAVSRDLGGAISGTRSRGRIFDPAACSREISSRAGYENA